MGMYRTIDEEEAAVADAPARGSSRWIFGSMAVALLTLVFVAWASMPDGSEDSPVTVADTQDARTAYLAALSEPSPALRRARLADFTQTHPSSDRADAVRAQLETLDAHEATGWARVTDALYSTRASRLDKLAALDAYEAVWGPDLIGGRRAEIAELRERLADEADEDDVPSRRLDEDPSPIPESISAGTMAGGPVTALPLPPPPQSIPIPALPPVDTVLPPRRRVVPPRVTSSPKPRYPRNALRRGVEAVVVISMDVDARGRVRDTRVVSVDADRYGKDFARSARRAAKRTRFEPRRVDGEARATLGVTKRYRFQL